MSISMLKRYSPAAFILTFVIALGLVIGYGASKFTQQDISALDSQTSGSLAPGYDTSKLTQADTSAPDSQITQAETSAPEFESTGSLAFFPKTVEDLVQDTDTVVIGTVKGLVGRVTFASYDENGEMKRADEINLPADADVSMFDYELQIERVLKPHEGVASKQSIILRMPFEGKAGIDYSTWDYVPSVPGERRLFFLGLNPDGKTYGLKYGPASRIIIDGATVRRTDGKQSEIPGKETSSPAAFIADVERIIEQQRTK